MSQPLIIALSKGRLLKETLPILAEAGIEPGEDLGSRKLIFDTNHEQIKFIVVRAVDVPTFVTRGVAHIGVSGRIRLPSNLTDLYLPVDLGVSACRLMTAGMVGAQVPQGKRACPPSTHIWHASITHGLACRWN